MPLISRTERLVALALVLINLALKLAWTGVNELAHDEPFTVLWSQAAWKDMWAMFRTENNPPLYFLLIKAWTALVPFDAAWLRIPSAVFSALAVWPLFLLGRQLGGSRTALLAGILYTCSSYHYGFAHEVRAYSLFTLLTITSIWLLVRAAQRPGEEVKLMLHLSMLNVVMVYTHFFGWLVVGMQGLMVFALPELRPLRRGFLWGATLTLACFLPYCFIFVERFAQSVGQGTWLTPPVPEELYNMLWRWSNAPVLTAGFLVLIVAAGFKERWRSFGMRISLLWTFVPLLGMFAVSFQVPMFLDRYLVYVAPGYALLVAISVETFTRKDRVRNLVAMVLGLGMAFTFAPWKESGTHPGRVVLQVTAWRSTNNVPVMLYPWYYMHTYAWHLDRELLKDPSGLQASLASEGIYPVHDQDGGLATGDHDTLLLVVASNEVGNTTALRAGLRKHLPLVDSVEADHKVWVYRFKR